MTRVLPLLLVLACTTTPEIPVGPCSQMVYDACVTYTADAPNLSTRAMASAFEAAARYWGTKPTALAGWTVVVRGRDPFLLGPYSLWGITHMDLHRMDFAVPLATCRGLVLTHEWGHAGAGIYGHDDARFAQSAIATFLGDGCPIDPARD